MLGNPAPSVSQNVASTSSAAAPSDLAACEQKAKAELDVVDSEPTTSVQVNLPTNSPVLVITLPGLKNSDSPCRWLAIDWPF